MRMTVYSELMIHLLRMYMFWINTYFVLHIRTIQKRQPFLITGPKSRWSFVFPHLVYLFLPRNKFRSKHDIVVTADLAVTIIWNVNMDTK